MKRIQILLNFDYLYETCPRKTTGCPLLQVISSALGFVVFVAILLFLRCFLYIYGCQVSIVILLQSVMCHHRNDEIEKNIQRCMGSCVMPKAQVYAPVCASDGNTYSSRHLVMCRDACSTQFGHGLQVVYEGPCSYAYNHQNPLIHG